MRITDIKRAFRLQLPPQHFSDAGPFLGSRPYEALPNITPVVTYSFILISVALFALTDLIPTDLDISKSENLRRLGFRDHFNIIIRDWWGLFTAPFFHGDLLHIGFNCMALALLGSAMERGIGSLRTLALYLLFGAVSLSYQILISGVFFIGDIDKIYSAVVLGYPPLGSSRGLSGIVFAIVGFMWGSWKRWTGFLSIFNFRLLQYVAFWQILCFVLTWSNLMPIGNAAHISGLAIGFCVGMWFSYGFKEAKLWSSIAIAIITLAIVGIVFYHFHFLDLIS